MGQIVVVAEKPSVGRDLARVLGCNTRGNGCLSGNGYTVTWAVGHLVTLQEPDEIHERYKKWRMSELPILPENIPLKVIRNTADQYKTVSALMNSPDTDSLVCATDAGREGELIFRYIYEKCGCKKPFQRLWISSMTDEAIKEGFRTLKDGHQYDGLYRSAQCRSQADWLVGMNATRAFTLRYDVLLSVGRVQTPTLAILVKRRLEIEHFKPEGFCTLTADFGDYKGVWFKENTESDTHIPTKEEAAAIAQRVKGQTGIVQSAQTSRKKDPPPQLYDLTSLQRDANRLLGFTADKTLKVAQSLYETRKALTYPRTDSRYLPPDMIPRVEKTMGFLPESYQPLLSGTRRSDGKLNVSKRTVDASKVTDHHAIIPTAQRVKPETFSEDERQLYDLVTRRMLTAFYPFHEYDATKVVTAVGEDTFRTNGKTVLVEGWRSVPPLANPPKVRKAKKEEEEDTPLPPLKEGDTRPVQKTLLKEDTTKPPAQHNDASLLQAMEHAGRDLDDEELSRQMKGSGIGTPATRASIIERLLQVGYAQRKGKHLIATDKGVQLIAIMPEELSSPATTGRWELALSQIADNEQDPVRFMEGIRKLSAFLVEYAQSNRNPAAFPADPKRQKARKAHLSKTSKSLAGCKCPLCGKESLQESSIAFSCTEAGCSFTLWKDCLTRGGGPDMTDKLLTLLLEKKQLAGSTGVILLQEGFISFYPTGHQQPTVRRSLQYTKG